MEKNTKNEKTINLNPNKNDDIIEDKGKEKFPRLKEIKWKTERFFGKNIIFFGIILVIALIKLKSAITNLEDTQDKLNKELSEIKMSYVSITDSGVLNNLPRTFVNPAEKSNEVAEILKKLLIDRATISKGFNISKIEKSEEILDNVSDLQTFVYNYILVQRGMNDEIKDKQKNGYGYFQAYLNSIQDLFRGITIDGRTAELPHYLKVIDKKVNTYEFKNNEFTINVTYMTVINTFMGYDKNNAPIWKQKSSTSTINATGYFDIQTQNIGLDYVSKDGQSERIKGTNYNGLHFTALKVTFGT